MRSGSNWRRTLASAVVAGLVVLGAAPVAHGFDEDCTGLDVLYGYSGCAKSGIDIRVDSTGNVELIQQTEHPRAAFDEFVSDVEQWSGGTEEYLEYSLITASSQPGITFTYQLDESSVLIISTVLLGNATGDAPAVGIDVEQDSLVVDLAAAELRELDYVTLTAPGRVQSTNGSVSGTTITWDGRTLETAQALTAMSDREPRPAELPWTVALIPVGAALLAAGVVVGIRGRMKDDR